MSISHYQSWCLNSNLHQRAHLLPAWRACLRCQVSPFCDLTQLQFRFGGLRSSRCRRGRHPLDLISNLHRVSGTRVRTEMTTTRPAPSCITVYPRDITGPVMLAPERSSVFGLPPAGQRPIPPRMSCQRSSPSQKPRLPEGAHALMVESNFLPSFWYYCHKILMPHVQTARKTLATCPHRC